MIRSIHIQGFKSLRDVDMQLGRVNLFVGTNSSGKSNFLEALRFLQGIALGLSVGDALNGRPRDAQRDEWRGIRGGSREAAFVPLGRSRRSPARAEVGFQTV